MMRSVLAGLATVALAIACQPGDPIEPRIPMSSPIPKVDRTDDPVVTPKTAADAG